MISLVDFDDARHPGVAPGVRISQARITRIFAHAWKKIMTRKCRYQAKFEGVLKLLGGNCCRCTLSNSFCPTEIP